MSFGNRSHTSRNTLPTNTSTRDAIFETRERDSNNSISRTWFSRKNKSSNSHSGKSIVFGVVETGSRTMISDSDLVTRLREILRDSDLDTATVGSIRRKLEEDFGIYLSDRKAFIRSQIDIYLETLGNNKEGQEEENIIENVKQNEEENKNGAVEDEEEDEKEEEDESGGQETNIKRSRKGEKDVKKRGGGFTKLCSLSPQLQNIVGVPQLARTQVVKRLWAYIRENNLQDPKNKRNIKCDEALHNIFRVNSINMFQMNKALSKHIWPLTAEDETESLMVKGEDGNDFTLEGDDPGGEEEDEEEREEEQKEEEAEQEANERSKKGGCTKVDKDVKKRGGGFTKLCSLSPQLQEFTGMPELARTEVVKRLWAYIRENNLQDPKNKKNILCDESLRALFCVDAINMFQMNKALSKHIWPLNEEDGPEKSLQMERQSKQEREEDETKRKEKRQKKGASGLLAPLPLSDALVKFFGTGENMLSRADVVKRMWEYIKQNDLQDPSDKRRIICDDKLKELFEVDSFNGFSVSKLLTVHFIKTEQ